MKPLAFTNICKSFIPTATNSVHEMAHSSSSTPQSLPQDTFEQSIRAQNQIYSRNCIPKPTAEWLASQKDNFSQGQASGSESLKYTVKKGDNLWKLLRGQGFSDQEIVNQGLIAKVAEQNGLENPNHIEPDQLLILPSKDKVSKPVTKQPKPTSPRAPVKTSPKAPKSPKNSPKPVPRESQSQTTPGPAPKQTPPQPTPKPTPQKPTGKWDGFGGGGGGFDGGGAGGTW